MNQPFTPPSTRKGLKRLAKRIRRDRGVKHAQALEQAAGISGFSNYRHAIKFVAYGGASAPADIPTYLTAYWIDPKTRLSGRETLTVWLPVPWAQIIDTRELRLVRQLRELKRAGDDHLQHREVVNGQDNARHAVEGAARVLQFMGATGLRPALSGDYRKMRYSRTDSLPGRDHTSIWKVRDGTACFVLDEPYAMAIGQQAAERAAWAHKNGFCLMTASWSGLYAPGMARFDLLADIEHAPRVRQLIDIIERLSKSNTGNTWAGESSPYRPLWVSPAAAQASKTPRAPHNGLLPSRRVNRTIGYGGYLVHRGARRPDARMPIEAHQTAGRLLKDAMAMTRDRPSAESRIDSVRSRLDDWVQREYNHNEMPNEVFLGLYYQNEPRPRGKPTAEERSSCIAMLARTSGLLQQHYPDCAPRAELLRKLALAQKAISTWDGSRGK